MSAVVDSTSRTHDPYASRVGDCAEIAPRIDPVVYDSKINDSATALTPAQLRSYDRSGFLEIDDLFTAAEVDALQCELLQLRTQHQGIDPDTLILEPDGRELRSIFRIHDSSPLMRRLTCDARLVRIAQRLLGDDVYIHQSRLNYKPGFFGKEFYWHSDFETWHVEDGMPRMRALSMSIALTENTPFNGPLMVIPRSHGRYVRCVGETPDEHYKRSLRKQEYGVPDPRSLERLFAEGGIAAPVGPPGKIVMFDCNTMHGSNSNISPLPRSNVFIVYNAVSNRLKRPSNGKPPRPEFIATRQHVKPIEPILGVLK